MDFLGDDDASPPTKLTINTDYAQKYEFRKKREELSNLKEKYGDLPLVSSSDSHQSSSSSDDDDEIEDEFGEDLTPEVDAQIMKTIAKIRNKDPELYDKQTFFFSDEALKPIRERAKEKAVGIVKADQERPYRIKDFHRDTLLAGEIPGAIDDERPGREMTYVEEQDALRDEFKNVTVDENDDDLFVPRTKTKEEERRDEDGYKEWLLETMKEENACKEVFNTWLEYQEKKRSDMDEKDKFLMDYILNRGWIDKDAADERAPSLQELLPEIEEDEEEVEKAEEFERKYNFRFEELANEDDQVYAPGSYGIVTHARNVPDSARRKESKRSEQRRLKEERKKEEKLKKAEELKRLKNLKKQEIRDKLKKIQEISGLDKVVGGEKGLGMLEGIDLDADFDSNDWDSKMNNIFGGEFYDSTEMEKPKFDDDDDPELKAIQAKMEKESAEVTKSLQQKIKTVNFDEFEFNGPEEEILDDDQSGYVLEKSEDKKSKKKKDRKKKKNNSDDEDEDDFIMDADYIAEMEAKQRGETASTSPSGVEGEVPANMDKLFEEYYQLDYEDMIGDLPTRFKYRHVDADQFGLTPEEILLADDKDLNEYISLKKLAPFRDQERDAKYFSRWKRQKGLRRSELRKKISEKIAELENEQLNDDFNQKRKKFDNTEIEEDVKKDKKKRKHEKKKRNEKNEQTGKNMQECESGNKLSNARLAAYGLLGDKE